MRSGASTPTSDTGEDDVFHDVCENFAVHELETLLESASAKKNEGNEALKNGDPKLAIQCYLDALSTLPDRAVATIEDPSTDSKESVTEQPTEISADLSSQNAKQTPEWSVASGKCATLRSVLNANLAACYLKQSMYSETVTHATAALEDDPTYTKALARRAQANNSLGGWGNLSSAKDDCEKVLSNPHPEDLGRQMKQMLASLPPRIQQAQDIEKEQMMGKLKELGNSVLGRFGLSTDNFKFKPNGDGGYGMSFEQNAANK